VRGMELGKRAPVETSPLKLVDLPIPDPAEREVLIRVKMCGICRTGLHVVEGDLPPHQQWVIPGHEVVGHIERMAMLVSHWMSNALPRKKEFPGHELGEPRGDVAEEDSALGH